MRVEISAAAKQDLRGIRKYIAADNASRAASFLSELRAACRRIGDAPLATQAHPELGEDIRCRPYRRYLIVLRVEADRVLIVRVLHGTQDIPGLFGSAAGSDQPSDAH